jgi:hypothetical protein
MVMGAFRDVASCHWRGGDGKACRAQVRFARSTILRVFYNRPGHEIEESASIEKHVNNASSKVS